MWDCDQRGRVNSLTIKTCSHKHMWADFHILRSRSSPFLKPSPSPIKVQNFFKLLSPSPKNLKNVTFSQQKCRISFPLNSVQIRSGSWILKRCTVRIQSEFKTICYRPRPVQCSSVPTSLHRRIITISYVFLCYVKRSLDKSRLIKVYCSSDFLVRT